MRLNHTRALGEAHHRKRVVVVVATCCAIAGRNRKPTALRKAVLVEKGMQAVRAESYKMRVSHRGLGKGTSLEQVHAARSE